MTGPARNSATDDEARWAEAQSILENRPIESAERRLHRARLNRLLWITTSVVLTVVVAMVVAILVIDGDGRGSTGDEHVPTWLAALGYCLSGLGLVIMVVGFVLLHRRVRRTRGWHSPLNVLTFRQRGELVAQLRGRAPVVPERAPLVAHLAEVLLPQRVVLLPQLGLLISFAGLWIADRSTWRLVLVVMLSVALLVAAVFGRREARVRRFLEAHLPVEERSGP